MLWILHALLELVAMIVAFFTNWLVVFFADEYGQLPKLLKWWQTWDNPLDISWVVYEGCVWKCFQYDFNKHYLYHYETWEGAKKIAGYVDLLDPDFTFKERVQRYFCRVYWLYRNSNYGFSYSVNGRTFNTNDLIVTRNIDELNNRQYTGYIKGGNIFTTTWSFFYQKQWCSKFSFRLYAGWKLKGEPQNTNEEDRAMLAISINPFWGID